MRVLIVGGGIGGLTTALALHAAGIRSVAVVEATREIRPLGVGINVLPHAVRELTELGLADDLAAAGIPVAELVYHSCFGAKIWAEPRGLAAGYRWPQYSIHRGELQMRLLRAVQERLGPSVVRAGMELRRFEQTPGGPVRAELSDRTAGGATRTEEADVLVGADGIHSTVRAQLHPNEGPALWNRILMWRGVTERPPFLGGRTMIMAGRFDQKFVAYPISRAHEVRGSALVNWVAELRLADSAVARRQDWTRRGDVEEVLAHFGDWAFDWLDIPALIRGAGAVYEYPMVDRDPLTSWTSGTVTLLGDAAHPMYPIGSNGASQAILDARVLALELGTRADPVEALLAYEERRRLPTAALVLSNRRMGPERVMQIVHDRAPRGFERLSEVISQEELEAVAAEYKRTAGFSVEELNNRPSWDATES